MRTREEYEQLERQALAPYAMCSQDSAGREHVEPPHPFRTSYQRDRDRIIHSAAFRRLEYKTQVFVIFEGDYYRTRLTHTLEVAQIGRSIGRALRLNEDLIEAIALAHDLGHPPFGHAGEDALKKIMTDAGAGSFNHNLRSFEVVTRLEKKYSRFPGLNLTREVLIGILKHQTEYDEAGFLEAYRDEGPTLEAQVVDFADSLAYLNHDVDDGLKSGCITLDDLLESELCQQAAASGGRDAVHDDLEMVRYQLVKALIDMQIRDLLTFTDDRLREKGFRSFQEVKAHQGTVVGFSPQMKQSRDALQEVVNRKLYRHYRVLRMTSKAKRVINDLFSVYLHEPFQLPPEVFPRDRECTDSEKYAIICHYVAGMTDRAALDEHKKFFNAYTKV